MTRPLRVPGVRPSRRKAPDPARARTSPDFGAPAPASLESARGTRFSETFRALRHRNYRRYYFGQSISLSGTWMQTVAQSWLVIQLTDSKAAVGLVTTLQFLPITLFVLFAGVIADRVPKRNFIICTQTLAMSQAAVLAFLVWSGQIELWHVYLLAMVLGLANALEQPTRQAFIVEMVGKGDLLNAVALNSGNFNLARMVGPAIGGVIIALAGVKVAFTINALSFLPVIAGLMMMDASDFYATGRRQSSAGNALGELREGLSFALRTPATLLIVIVVAAIGTFGYNFIVVLPLVARYVLDGGSVQLGFLTASLALGALLSALVIAGGRRAGPSTLFVAGALFAAFLGAVALSQWFALTLVLLLLVGMANIAFGTTSNTLMQLATPDRLRGRVMALYMLLVAGSTPIGASLTGIIAEVLGVQAAVGILAALCLVGLIGGLLYYISHRTEVESTAYA